MTRNKEDLLRSCVQYILDCEGEDYETWCAEEGMSWENYQENSEFHIYATAMLAWDKYYAKKESL